MASEQSEASSNIFVRNLRNFSRPFKPRACGQERIEDTATKMDTDSDSSSKNNKGMERSEQHLSEQNRQDLDMPEGLHRQPSRNGTVAPKTPLQDNPDEMHRRFGGAWETLTRKSERKEPLKDALAATRSQAKKDKARGVRHRPSEGRHRP